MQSGWLGRRPEIIGRFGMKLTDWVVDGSLRLYGQPIQGLPIQPGHKQRESRTRDVWEAWRGGRAPRARSFGV